MVPERSREVREGEDPLRHSPLYERLARGVAEDREMLTLAAHARSTP
jgi:hypothetical protein